MCPNTKYVSTVRNLDTMYHSHFTTSTARRLDIVLQMIVAVLCRFSSWGHVVMWSAIHIEPVIHLQVGQTNVIPWKHITTVATVMKAPTVAQRAEAIDLTVNEDATSSCPWCHECAPLQDLHQSSNDTFIAEILPPQMTDHVGRGDPLS